MTRPRSPTEQRVVRLARISISFTAAFLLLSWNSSIKVSASAGDLDPAFGTGGKVSVDLARNEIATAVAVQSDGKIVAAGAFETKKKSYDFALVRYNYDGNLDASFGSNGATGLDFFGNYDFAHGVAIQPDGKIVVAGEVHDAVDGYFGVARFNVDGSLDGTFGGDGTVTTKFFDMADPAFALALQSDGKIVVGGFAFNSAGDTSYDFALARYNADGSLDTSFGEGGKVVTDFAKNVDILYALGVQQDGKIVAAGYAELSEDTLSRDFAVARYNPDGSLDTSFGGDGRITTDIFGERDEAYALALTSDGKVIVAGYGGEAVAAKDFAIVQYTSAGTLDDSFGSDGRVTTDFFGDMDSAFGVAIQANGKVLAAGYALISSSMESRDFALARYNPDGTLDSVFGSGGKVTTDFFGSQDLALAVAVMPNGRLIAAGYASGSSSADLALACYYGDGLKPEITGAEVIGKKLYVHGKYFDFAAEVLVNGVKQKKTINDGSNPTTLLIGKKTGKKIARGETVTLQVRNPDGSLSNEFAYTRPVQ
jgi:uncharacterized delta-60 repeat protein